jgi:hypothetical protein
MRLDPRLALALALAVALAAAAAGAPAPAAAAPGAVDWERKVVTCTGSGAANLRDAGGNVAAARIGAERAARLDALRSCLETLQGVQLEAGRTVGGALRSDSALGGRVEGLVRGFRTVGKPRYYDDGGVEIDVEVPLEGALSDALLPRGATPAATPTPASTSTPTSLVLDARGTKVVPALAPRVRDEAGRELYGPAALGDAARRAGGAAAYARDLESARGALGARLGDRPLVVKALRADGPDLVVSSADAAALERTDRSFLAQGRVVILAD